MHCRVSFPRGIAFALTLVSLLPACSDDGANGNEPKVVTRVTIEQDSVQLSLASKDTLTARAINANGNTVSGAAITWTSSDANVAPVTADGIVSARSAGMAFIKASVGAFSDSAKIVVLRDTTPPSDVSVTIRGPMEHQFVGDSVHIQTRISTKYSLASLRLTAGSLTVPLDVSKLTETVPYGGSLTWDGYVSLLALPAGPLTLQFSATDIMGTTSASTVGVQHDVAPRVTITSPLNSYDVFTTSVPIHITCVDPESASCVSLTVDFSGTGANGTQLSRRVASGTSAADVDVPTTDWGVTAISVQISAQDVSRQGTIIIKQIFVANSPALQRIASVPGTVVDADGSRILYTGAKPALMQLFIRGASGTDETVFAGAGANFNKGFLMPMGALYQYAEPSAPGSGLLREFRNGATLVLNGVTNELAMASPHAAWTYPSGTAPSPLTIRDFNTGQQRTVAIARVSGPNVSPDGHVVYTTIETGQVWLDGKQLTSDTSAQNLYPMTDGKQVVYAKWKTTLSGPNYFVVLNSITREDTLAAYRAQYATNNFRINAGWVAYSKPDATGVLQLRVRSPAGVDRQVSPFAVASGVVGLGSTGSVIFGANNQTYLSSPPYMTVTPIGSANAGTWVWRNDQFLLLLGGSVFRVGE